MSFFYLSPVKGDLPFHLLEKIITKRLEYLRVIYKGETPNYNEYVIEGSIYDNVGHFMLCILTILDNNTDFTRYFLKTESELFKTRLQALSAYDLRNFGKKLVRNIRKLNKYAPFIEPLENVCQYLTLKDISHHICLSLHSNDCSLYSIKVNFKNCLPFVARRQVEVVKGVASIPCSKWKQYLLLLFNNNLQRRIYETNLDSMNDPRISDLLIKLRKLMNFTTNSNCATNVLLSKNVDVTKTVFPPCMLNLHENLRRKHRLSHHQRFYYSLFLKDIGMPIEEAINFWQAEYSHIPNGTHSCCHNWAKDEKKYVYGIRHMYGLEGSRKSYPSVNCKRIQNSDASSSEGGCPFKCFDKPNMLQILEIHDNEVLLSQINELKNKNRYTSACLLYLRNRHSKLIEDCDDICFNFTPVKYYFIASQS